MRWLAIVGIGEDGIAGLGETARRRIAQADIVFGGARHLELAGAIITGERRAWDSPFIRSIEAVLAERGRAVCVLASGDPFHYGVGATLSRHVDAAEMEVLPHPSSFSLAAGRMGWPLQDVICLSLHGRALDLIRPHLHPGARILALTSDEAGPATLAQSLDATGFGETTITVLEALGGPEEKVRVATAARFALPHINPLNICAIEVAAAPGARILPFTAGRDDALFEHDGQITKREVRALTLAALAPRRGELLWDIGAGSGSVGIEWMLADVSLRVIAIEADAERVVRIGRNAAAFGVPDLRVVHGAAPIALGDLPRPDAIFIGGGGTERGVMDAAVAALPSGGRLVANAVTTQLEALLLARHVELGGQLTRIAIDRAAPIGGMTGWRPHMPITQWSWIKP
ncbi:MAG: cbiE [Devosia sp.]|uniref:precorrin-6y C5,15-methyltransferase (decarboxylating) subunit CbiE n=1 Tax=Devosia sp. TaxID=1871048 RepID=UPI00262F1965|nr:precorrin-6y C5,15-methyltransferase (decarboxylating) subunit CbiE [Devosia sp.]MDB5530660.1 cbiE [Devosia sp.]